eukprot:scaffold21413_cov48-Phaeocystis_antarctica.AAC.2
MLWCSPRAGRCCSLGDSRRRAPMRPSERPPRRSVPGRGCAARTDTSRPWTAPSTACGGT